MSALEIKEGVRFTEKANLHIKDYLAKNPQSLGLRIAVKKTGCSGYAYAVDLAQESQQNDQVFQMDGFTVYIDDKSYPFLKGMQVDYVKDRMNEKFSFSNPNETGSCGCGESFTV